MHLAGLKLILLRGGSGRRKPGGVTERMLPDLRLGGFTSGVVGARARITGKAEHLKLEMELI